MSMLGAMEASKAPRKNRIVAKPAKFVHAVIIHRLAPQPKKQTEIQMLTGKTTRAYTLRGWS